MDINKTKENATLKIELVGRLDTTTAPELESDFTASCEGITDVEINFEKLEYISSAGLRVLLSIQKKVGEGHLVIINANDSIKEVFDMTGFSDILTIK